MPPKWGWELATGLLAAVVEMAKPRVGLLLESTLEAAISELTAL
jgi:hypothetical protein